MYIEVLGKIDLDAMYKITTQERLLQNLVYEYERFADPRLVPPFWSSLIIACLLEESWKIDRDVLYNPRLEWRWPSFRHKSLRFPPRSFQNRPELLS